MLGWTMVELYNIPRARNESPTPTCNKQTHPAPALAAAHWHQGPSHDSPHPTVALDAGTACLCAPRGYMYMCLVCCNLNRCAGLSMCLSCRPRRPLLSPLCRLLFLSGRHRSSCHTHAIGLSESPARAHTSNPRRMPGRSQTRHTPQRQT